MLLGANSKSDAYESLEAQMCELRCVRHVRCILLTLTLCLKKNCEGQNVNKLLGPLALPSHLFLSISWTKHCKSYKGISYIVSL